MTQPPITSFKHLRVDFGDNDFGGYVESTLTKLWDWIHGSNAHCLRGSDGPSHESFSDRTIADIFLELHKTGTLEQMLNRTFLLEYLHGSVEYATRGLYWTKVNWNMKSVHPVAANELEAPVSLSAKFMKDGRFKKKWNNGESAFLDLTTGKLGTF